MSNFSENLKNLRLSKNISQKQVADCLGIADRQYRRYENNEQQPTLPILTKLADYFNVSLDYLAGRSNFKSVVTEDKKGNIVTVNSDNPEINK